MRTLSPILAAVLLAAAPGALTIGLAEAQTCACPPSVGGAGPAPARIIADEPPPPLPEYEQPPIPAPGYMWTPGYWGWNNDDYYWVPGTWVQPPHPGLLWTPGYWGFVNGVYQFNHGYWGPHVGFYGGVAYGFGYFGAGFEGGRWQGDHFYYNRTVNNFGSVNITNVYEHPAPRIVERASFNGGPEGLKARPTNEELAAAREQHVAATEAQRRNVRAASRNEDAFVTNNQGKPPVAATQRPGEFKGAAVAPAKAAGGPVKARPLEEATPGRNENEKAAPEGEKARPQAEKPETKAEPEKAEPKAEKAEPKAQKAEPKAERAEPKAEKPTPKAEKTAPKAERAEPKAERAEPKAERPKAEAAQPKAKPEPKAEPKAEPKPEKPRAAAERPRPAAEPQRAKPEPRPAGAGRAACHPGEAHCPK
jgi:hypothetical protein